MNTVRRLLALLLLLAAIPAQAAITFVAASNCIDVTVNGDAVCQPAVPTGTTDGDEMIAYAFTSSTITTGTGPAITPPSGWTEIGSLQDGTEADRRQTIYKRTASSESAADWTATYAGTGSNYISVVIETFRGASATLDVTYVEATHTTSPENTITPDPSDITTATNNAFVVSCMGASHNEITAWGASSGFTIPANGSTTVGSTYRYAACEYIDAGTAGAETVGAWTNTGTVSTADALTVTIALKPGIVFPGVCAGGRTVVGITDTSNSADADNILNGQSPAIVANEDTICIDPVTDILSDTATLSVAGWVTFASGGDNRTDDIDYCIMYQGAACGADGTYQMTTTPVLATPTAAATGQTTADLSVLASLLGGTAYACVQTAAKYDLYGAPSHAQIAAGHDGHGDACTFAASDASVSATQTFSATGLTAGTAYRASYGQANAATTPLTATVVTTDAWTTTAVGDTSPTPFSFTDVGGINPSTALCSAAITVAGINAATIISVTGGTYKINGGSETSAEGTVVVTDTVSACGVASSESSDPIDVTVTIGDQSDTWTMTTRGFHAGTAIDLLQPIVRSTVRQITGED